MPKKNIIEKVFPKDESNHEIIKDMALVTGKKNVPPPFYYRNIENGAEYWTILAGIGWPGKIEERGADPGFAVIVAVDKTDSDKPTFRLLAEVQRAGVEELMRDCIGLQQKYGHSEGLLDYFLGDHEGYTSVYHRINEEIKRQGISPVFRGFYVNPPEDFDKPNAFDLYADSIRSVLGDEKRLFLDEGDLIRAHLQNLKKDSPAILALGGVIHTLLCQKPWRKPVNDGPHHYVKFED
ncbi:MAG: hypothetical protein C4530_14520 [Desulfobacteraceae bacterium]|nr:MAG: hypothetical protein C4530_14520 [Desulfobacteraceae bacterium]